jgi:hypothetical protein
LLIRLLGACAALAFLPLATTAAAETPTTKAVAAPKVASEAKIPKVDPAKALAGMMVVFDRFFPAGPEPEPARLGLARNATLAMFPKGAYAEGVNGFMESMVERVLDMSEADLAAMGPAPKLKKGEKPKTPSNVPLRLAMAKKDPMFDAKLAAGKGFARTMFVKVGDVTEPRFREGMARTLARKFDARQLAEIRAFLATPTGAAYGRQMVGLWFEPEVMRATFQAFPDIMALMPDLMKEGAAFDKSMKETAKPAPAK